MKFYTAFDLGWGRDDAQEQAIKITKGRIFPLMAFFVIGFLVVIGRLTNLMLVGEQTGAVRSTFAHQTRAEIVDRNGEVLATSLPTFSLYANPKVVLHPEQTAQKLCGAFPELIYKDVLRKISSGRGFVWLLRHLTPQKQDIVLQLGLPGIYLQPDERRLYPHGALASHALGMTNIDNIGIAGLEKQFNEKLSKEGEPLRLSLDVRVQHVLRDVLLTGVQEFSAKGAQGVILNAKTGEIVAMVSLPDFDPNLPSQVNVNALFNRVTLGVYEMGSILKIINTAMVLDSKTATLETVFDASQPLKVGRFKITDFKGKYRPLTVREAFLYSSNIANAKMALAAGKETQAAFMERLGFFKPLGVELPEIGSPLLPKHWSEATSITSSYGYGISLTPLQVVTAMAGILNDGMMIKPTLLYREGMGESKRVTSQEVSQQMRDLLRQSVLEGRATKAQVEGYDVGGKTGTANLKEVGVKGYQQKNNLTSFFGALPMSDPKYVFLITLDRPQPTKATYGYATAGWIAAPLAARVVARIAPLLGIEPEFSEESSPLLLTTFKRL